MIDPTDKQTEALPLEPAKPGKLSNVTKKTASGFAISKNTGFPEIEKRGRGRPSTGQAMTPAEKQRAYRKRLADQQKSQVPAVQLEKVRSTAAEYLEKLGQQLADAKAENEKLMAMLEAAQKEISYWTQRALQAGKGNVTEKPEIWQLQCKNEKGRWRTSDQYGTERQAENALLKVHNPEFWRIRKK